MNTSLIRKTIFILCASAGLCLSATALAQAVPTDPLYDQIIDSVANADFDAMASTYHPDAILVSTIGTKPIANVIPQWRNSGEQVKEDGGSASVAFRFSSRQIDESTGFESGIFRYQSTDANGNQKTSYVYFESLTINQGGQWLTLMERQKGPADKAMWEQLAPR